MDPQDSAPANGRPLALRPFGSRSHETAMASWEAALPAGPHAPVAARTALADWLERRVPRRVLEDARLLASELVTNSVRHAGLAPARDSVRVGVELATGVLRLRVEDSGTTGTLVPRTPDPASGSGYGLNIVAGLASQWGVSRNGSTTVWAVLTWTSATRQPVPG
jgi:anti-sigma regulatory factor (Ser/Thr protein kinase)